MTTILIILAAVALLGVARALQAIGDRRRERQTLREELGDDYEHYLRMRKRK